MRNQTIRITILTTALAAIFSFHWLDTSRGQITLPNHVFWIAIRTDGQSGTGTIVDPFDGSTAAKLDALMDSYQSTPGIVWNFMEGTFQTDVNATWYIKRDWVMQGRGMDLTKLQLSGSFAASTAGSEVAAITSEYYTSIAPDRAVVRDMTIDQNWGNLATTAPIGAGTYTVGGGITTNASPTVSFATTTIASGSDGQHMPQSTVYVASTADFPSSGTFWVYVPTIGYRLITYTGKTSTTFTGCTGGEGPFATGQYVSTAQLNFAHDFARTLAGTGIPTSSPVPTILRLPTTTIAAGSNGASLPQSTISVASTSDFASQGVILVETSVNKWQIVTYTGKTSTTFTGCAGGSGTMTIGGSVNTDTQLVMSANATATGTQVSVTVGGERNVKTAAVRLVGTNNLIERVRSINSYGSADNGLEHFAIAVSAADNQYANAVTSWGSTIRFCEASSIYGTYGCPYQIGGGQFGDYIARQAEVKVYGNTAQGVNDGQFYVFTTGGVNTAFLEDAEIYGNTFVDNGIGVYNDTGNSNRIKVHDNVVIRALFGASWITQDEISDIEVYNNTFGIQNRYNTGHAFGIIIQRWTGGTSYNHLVHDNKITWDGTGGRGYGFFRHLWFNNLRDSVIINNICDEREGGANCSPQNVSLFNNRTSAGKILTALCGSFEDNIIPPIYLCGDKPCD